MISVDKPQRVGLKFARASIWTLAMLFCLVTTWTSYARWADFRYRTFDLAYYVQGIWQFLHGRFSVTVEPLAILGNHVEPIVFLVAPLFAIFSHPMLFVAVQNIVLALLGPIGFDIGRRLGLTPGKALLLAAALLLAPAAGFIALHEFHPEAFAATLILLMLRARLMRSLPQHWIWFCAVLMCKENMALLLAAYCIVNLLAERQTGFALLRSWYFWPLILAAVWFCFCTTVITPALNSGTIDYVGLYSHVGGSSREILLNAFTKPQLFAKALAQSLSQGNIIWALLIPFLCLPLLAPRWLLVATPILLQHLLSWRYPEWTIYFHYSAPLLPLFWMATIKAIADGKLLRDRVRFYLPFIIIVSCLATQIWFGPAREITSATEEWLVNANRRAEKSAFIEKIPSQASVIAPLPYLSHLATREKLYSLHHILKGLKTLSRIPFEPPPPPDFVLIDYDDSSTFDASLGYYHPTMITTGGIIIPSSDQRLHSLLAQCSWISDSVDGITLLRQRKESPIASAPNASAAFVADLGKGNRLLGISKSGDTLAPDGSLEIDTNWNFDANRGVFPWFFLQLRKEGETKQLVLTRGLCAPEISAGSFIDRWRISSLDRLPPGEYALQALFVDNTRRVWSAATGEGQTDSALLGPPLPLGRITISSRKQDIR